jgi:hypothetical protein
MSGDPSHSEPVGNVHGLLLAAALRSRTDAVVATLYYRVHD